MADETRAFTYATPWRTGHEDEEAMEARKIRKRCCRCFFCSIATFLIIVIILIILIFTVFKVKDPTISLNSITFDNLAINNSSQPSQPSLPSLPNSPAALSSNPSINATMTADLSVKNPNIASFKFNPGTTLLYYYGSEVGKAVNPAGNAQAKKTMKMYLTIDLYVQADSSSPGKLQHLTSDLTSGKMTIDTYTVLDGRVNVINIFKKNLEIKMNCTMVVGISTSAMTLEDMNCSSDVKAL